MPTPEPAFLHHIAVASADPERLAAFYENTLLLRKVRTNPDSMGVRSIWLALGSSLLMVERCDERAEPSSTPFHSKRPGFHLLALSMDAGRRAHWKAILANAGTLIEEESEHSIYFRDPDGNRLALSHFPL